MGVSEKSSKATARRSRTRKMAKTIIVMCITHLAHVLNPLSRVTGGGFNRRIAQGKFFAPMKAHLAVGGLDTWKEM